MGRVNKIVAVFACMAAVVSLTACGQPRRDACASMSTIDECSDQMRRDMGIEGMHCAPDSTQAELEACGKRVAEELGMND